MSRRRRVVAATGAPALPASAGDARSGPPAPVQPIAPPGVREHLADLVRRPEAWAIVARNLVPVVGVLALGWSASLVVFNLWFDGQLAMLAIITAILPRALRETREEERLKWGPVRTALAWVVTWGLLALFLCLPYWIVLIPLGEYLLNPAMWAEIRSSPGLWATFGGIAVGHLFTAFRRGYDELPERELKQRLRTDVYLLILRALAMFFVAANLPLFLFVPALAAVCIYLEVWPRHALGAVFGDPDRLWEHDPR